MEMMVPSHEGLWDLSIFQEGPSENTETIVRSMLGRVRTIMSLGYIGFASTYFVNA